MEQINLLALLFCVLSVCCAFPEPPKSRFAQATPLQREYGPPAQPQREYGLPQSPQKEYGPPPLPQKQYVPPSQSLPVYGPPAVFYGPPVETIVTKNVYVHVPPEEPEIYSAPEPIQTALPKKHYKIIFIKAPNPPTPIRQLVSPSAQDEHKTLVYVLVKKPEDQQPLIVPSPAPTEPSKPEVYFIKYKQTNKPADQYGPPSQVENI